MGALVTLDLPADSPVQDLPWIITIGPMHDDEEWEPVVCGPYERVHALALAEAVVADEDLMAVVEPLLPLVDPAAIADEIGLARAATSVDPLLADLDDDRDGDGLDGDGLDGDGLDGDDLDGEPRPPRVATTPPTEAQVRAGFARIAQRLTGSA